MASVAPTNLPAPVDVDAELQQIYGANDNATRPAPPTSFRVASSATTSSKASAQPTNLSKKKKLRNRRRLYVDADGAATVEKATSGNATVVGVNVNVPVKALPAQAQLALQKNQRNFGANDNQFDDDEEEYEDGEDGEEYEGEHSPTRGYQLGAFLKNAPSTSSNSKATTTTDEQLLLESPEMCIQITNSTADQLSNLIANSEGKTLDQKEIMRLKTSLATQQSILNNFVSTVTDETLLCNILTCIDRCNTALALVAK